MSQVSEHRTRRGLLKRLRASLTVARWRQRFARTVGRAATAGAIDDIRRAVARECCADLIYFGVPQMRAAALALDVINGQTKRALVA